MTIALDERPTWQEVVLSFAPPARRTPRATLLLARLPIWLILALQAVLTWRLSDIANDDESLYIDAGHDVLSHALAGSHIAAYGSYLSGAPAGYPVPAAILDSLGGLDLVRLFSLACLLTCTLCVWRSSQYLFGRKAGLFAALGFAVSGSVLFVGKLATYDAPCLALIALAMALAVTRNSVVTAPVIGALLALAATTKYAGAVFVPVVLAICLLSDGADTVRAYVRPVTRTAVTALTAVGVLLTGYHLWGASIRQGLQFTTTGRKALDYQPTAVLVRSVVDDIGLFLVLAVVGLVLLAGRRSWKKFLLGLVCLGGGLLLPLSQVRIHEFTSLDKHTAFSALFLSLPAGVALAAAFTRRGITIVAAAAVLWLVLIDGLWRSEQQYSWPSSLTRTLTALEATPVPGTYVSIDGDALRYYSTQDPRLSWRPSSFAYSLFEQRASVAVAAVRSHRFAGLVYHSGGVTAPVQRSQAAVATYLAHDPYYQLVAQFRVGPYGTSEWYVWQKRPDPPRTLGAPSHAVAPHPAPIPVRAAFAARLARRG
jgi:hypothetical protein